MRHIKRVAVLTAITVFLLIIGPLPAKTDKPAQVYTIIVRCPADQRSGVQTALIDLGTFTVTAYSADPRDSGNWGNQTKSGITAVEGITIAADWRVLPKGTKVYIDGVGYRAVQDVGGKIKGRHIDVYFGSHETAVQFGKQKLEIYREA